ncbi:MAG TPA: diaminopimelate decarboxylase [Firmicutes bacterium]|nr:diaminopimelate decarboxylase [Bacillota bacterium]
MILRGTASINGQGHLEIGGMDTEQLVEKYGTPLMVYDVALIKERARMFLRVVNQKGVVGRAFYATKALNTTALLQLLAQEGMGFDVVSGGEFYTALKAGVNPKNILFHGNNKNREELELALSNGIGTIVIDNFYEIELLEQVAKQLGVVVSCLLRVTPGVDAYTHKYIITGNEDSKFGFDLNNGQADRALSYLHNHEVFDLKGIHSHIGSQIFGEEGYMIAMDRIFSKLLEWKIQHGFTPRVLNIGGGFGIRYSMRDHLKPYEGFITLVVEKFIKRCHEIDIPVPQLWIEPGRSVVGEAGTTLYTIGARKEIPGIRTYVSVNGGMTDNIRPALYQAVYEAVLSNRMLDETEEEVTIAGRCCESADVLVENIKLAQAKPGDTLAIFCTGAYGYSMASNYNKVPRPAVVFVENFKDQLVVRRETYDDLIQYDFPLEVEE